MSASDDKSSTTKRQTILLLLSGVISKMAHADESGNLPKQPIWTTNSEGLVRFAESQPMGITLNLDSFTGVTVTMGGKEVTITSAELFKALSS